MKPHRSLMALFLALFVASCSATRPDERECEDLDRSILTLFMAFLAGPFTHAEPMAAEGDGTALAFEARFHERQAPAIVGIELTITGQRTNAQSGAVDLQDIVSQGVGTVISPDGLVVTSLASLDFLRLGADPRTESSAVPPRAGAGRIVMSGRLESADQLKGAKIRTASGDWVPATILLKDAELDLVFLAPVAAPATPWPCVVPEKAAAYAWHGRYYVPFRFGKEADWLSSLGTVKPEGELRSPRRYFIASSAHAGCPVLNEEGGLLGLVVFRPIEGKPRQGKTAVLAAEELLPLVARAKAAREVSAAK